MLSKPNNLLEPALTLAANTLRLSRLPPRNMAAPQKAPALIKPRRLRPTIFSRSVDWFSSNRLTSGSLQVFAATLKSDHDANVSERCTEQNVGWRELHPYRFIRGQAQGSQVQRLGQRTEGLAIGQADAHFAGPVFGLED